MTPFFQRHYSTRSASRKTRSTTGILPHSDQILYFLILFKFKNLFSLVVVILLLKWTSNFEGTTSDKNEFRDHETYSSIPIPYFYSLILTPFPTSQAPNVQTGIKRMLFRDFENLVFYIHNYCISLYFSSSPFLTVPHFSIKGETEANIEFGCFNYTTFDTLMSFFYFF